MTIDEKKESETQLENTPRDPDRRAGIGLRDLCDSHHRGRSFCRRHCAWLDQSQKSGSGSEADHRGGGRTHCQRGVSEGRRCQQ